MSDLDTNPLISSEERFQYFITKVIASVITVLILSVVSCTMHSNAYEADVISQEAKVTAEQTKMKAEAAKVSIEQIQARERMIADGANPIAIRCMEEGWYRDNNVCLAVGVALGKSLPEYTGN